MATFVLVHGAWHGGWCWSRVARLLRGQGHDVFTPTLTGVGERTHLNVVSVDLSLHVRDVLNLLDWEDLSDVVLCGHSYGGMVITGVADRVPDRIRALVYLDAMVPDDGQSAFDLVGERARARFLDGAATNRAMIPPIPAAGFSVNAADAAWVDAKCVPMPLACMVERIALTGAHERVARRSYVCATGWGKTVFMGVRDRLREKPGWTLHDMPVGHDVMVDDPAGLAQLLSQV